MFDYWMTTFPFMVAVLGSVTFWVIYGLITLVIGTVCIRLIAPDTHRCIVAGNTHAGSSYMCWEGVVIVALLNYALWPVILAAAFVYYFIKIVIGKFLFSKVIGPAFQLLYKNVDKAVPNVRIDID